MRCNACDDHISDEMITSENDLTEIWYGDQWDEDDNNDDGMEMRWDRR